MIPVYQPMLTENERTALLQAFDTGWISGAGPEIPRSEEILSNTFGGDTALVSNGTTALHLALQAVGIGTNDRVMVPTFCYVAAANAIRYCGALPVFVDCCPETWVARAEDYEMKFERDVKAIIVVYNYGAVGKVDDVINWARQKKLHIIEDCAEAIGCYSGEKHVGSLGDVGTFSFYGNKTITCGEGGAVLTKSSEIMRRVKALRSQGLSKHRRYWHDIIGYNYRLNNLSASLLPSQIARLDEIVKRKKNIFHQYYKGLSALFEFQKFDSENCPWMVSILLPASIDRDLFSGFLSENEIETRPLFYPIHTMPPYFSSFSPLQNSEQITSRGLNLPSGPGTTDSEINHVITVVKRGLAELG